MKLTRREMLLASLSAMIAGCASNLPTSSTRRPGPTWPVGSTPAPTPAPSGPVYQPAPPPPPVAIGPINAIPRSTWAGGSVIKARTNPMNGISRITVHHEGSTIFTATDQATTAKRIESVRQYHTRERGFGDIAYHYVVDRKGRVWEGRPIQYQGAHVSGQNENNIGVMCLGNFNNQSPTDAQLDAMQRTVRSLSAHYRVPRSRIYTHRELGPTTCPGTNLQPRVASLRSRGLLA